MTKGPDAFRTISEASDELGGEIPHRLFQASERGEFFRRESAFGAHEDGPLFRRSQLQRFVDRGARTAFVPIDQRHIRRPIAEQF